MLQLHLDAAGTFLVIASRRVCTPKNIHQMSSKYSETLFYLERVWMQKNIALKTELKVKKRPNVVESCFRQPDGYVSFI